MIILTACQNQSPVEKEDPGISIMAYYMARNNYPPSEIPVAKLSHVIFSFTEVINNKMAFRDSISSQKLKELVSRKQDNKNLKVMIACGGWGGSGGFSDMALTAENRKIFIESVIEFIEEYNLDGLDIDWEYPGLPGIGNTHRPEDRENFTALMKELRESMDNTGKDLTLTFAAAAWPGYFDNIETAQVMKYADYINLMTYDFTGGAAPFSQHHSNLGDIDIEDPAIDKLQTEVPDWQPRSVVSIVEYCKQISVNPEQIIIGAAFYGKSWKLSQTDNNGLYQATDGPQNGWPSYSEIINNIIGKNAYSRYWDDNALAAWLFSPEDSVFISYDDKESVRLKTEYVIENGLGGIMFWEQSQDTRDGNGLLNTIYSTARGF